MIHRVKIEKIITGGFGLGRLEDGIIVMSRFVLPGETVRLEETFRHKGYIEALPVEIIDAAPERVAPPCPYFTLCGGCNFQHIDAPCQHLVKTGIVKEALNRAHVDVAEPVIHPLISSPLPYHYRFRLRLKVGSQGQLGFYRAGSNDLVDINRCLLATENINMALEELKNSNPFKRSADQLTEIELQQSPSDNRVIAVLYLRPNKNITKPHLTSFAASLGTIDDVLLRKGKKLYAVDEKKSQPVLHQDFAGDVCGHAFTLSWSAGCFSQVNALQNQKLIGLVCEQYRQTNGQNTLELYCGMGNFSIPVALAGARITGVEQNPESIRWAQINAKKSGLDNCRFQVNNVSRYLQILENSPDRFDTVFLDPPRQGLGKNTKTLARLAPQHIIYISCDPATLARDLNVLINSNYSLKNLTPVDMFPQTHHVESVALLEKN